MGRSFGLIYAEMATGFRGRVCWVEFWATLEWLPVDFSIFGEAEEDAVLQDKRVVARAWRDWHFMRRTKLNLGRHLAALRAAKLMCGRDQSNFGKQVLAEYLLSPSIPLAEHSIHAQTALFSAYFFRDGCPWEYKFRSICNSSIKPALLQQNHPLAWSNQPVNPFRQRQRRPENTQICRSSFSFWISSW